MKYILIFLTVLSTSVFADVIKGTGTIIKVVDGDTYDIMSDSSDAINKMLSSSYEAKKHIRGNTFRVRLANVDTEESNHPDASRNTNKGKLTKYTVKKLLTDKPVEFSCYTTGKYGRQICSVTVLSEGSTYDVGYRLISTGLSAYYRKYGDHPDPKLHQAYLNAQQRKDDAKNFAGDNIEKAKNWVTSEETKENAKKAFGALKGLFSK